MPHVFQAPPDSCWLHLSVPPFFPWPCSHAFRALIRSAEKLTRLKFHFRHKFSASLIYSTSNSCSSIFDYQPTLKKKKWWSGVPTMAGCTGRCAVQAVVLKGSGWWLRQRPMKTQDIEVPHWCCRLAHYRIFEGHGIPLHMRLCEEILWCDRLYERQGFRQQRAADPTVRANAVHYIWIRCCVWKVPLQPKWKKHFNNRRIAFFSL